MDPVVTREDSTGALYELLFLLILSWVVIGTASFSLGWFCHKRARKQVPSPDLRTEQGKWHRLVFKALTFVRRRRGLALAFNNLGNSTLRNSPNSRPNLARRNQRARNQTPGQRVLNEGPAIPHRDGPHRRRAGADQ